MLMNLLLGLPTMVLCLCLQSLLFAVAIHYYARRESDVANASFLSTIAVITGVMIILVVGNVAQVTIWALLFMLLDEFDSLAIAVYHSAVNFSTLGYGDIVMSEKHRLLGPLEAINGVLMIGASTAALTAAFHDATRKTARARKHRRADAVEP